MQLAALDTDMYTKEASCILSNLKIYEIILPNAWNIDAYIHRCWEVSQSKVALSPSKQI